MPKGASSAARRIPPLSPAQATINERDDFSARTHLTLWHKASGGNVDSLSSGERAGVRGTETVEMPSTQVSPMV
jgi:hypothetical protein